MHVEKHWFTENCTKRKVMRMESVQLRHVRSNLSLHRVSSPIPKMGTYVPSKITKIKCGIQSRGISTCPCLYFLYLKTSQRWKCTSLENTKNKIWDLIVRYTSVPLLIFLISNHIPKIEVYIPRKKKTIK